MAIDWQVLLVIPSDQITRERMISAGDRQPEGTTDVASSCVEDLDARLKEVE